MFRIAVPACRFDTFPTRALALNLGGRAVVAGDLSAPGLMVGIVYKSPEVQ